MPSNEVHSKPENVVVFYQLPPSYPHHNLKSTLGFSGLIVKEAGFIKNRMQTSPWDMQLPASNLSYRYYDLKRYWTSFMIFRKNRIKLLKTEGAFVGQLGWFYPIVGIGISIKEWTSVLLLTDIVILKCSHRQDMAAMKSRQKHFD